MASQVTTTASKNVSFNAPYIGTTFQKLAADIFGRDGYLGGGQTSDNGVQITIEPFKMVSRGIIGETLEDSVVDVPAAGEPWYIVASIPDDGPESGIIVQVTRSLAQAATGVVIAAKSGTVWRNPYPVDVAGSGRKAAEVGTEDGFSSTYQNTGDVYDGTDGTTVVEKVLSNRGLVVTPEGQRVATGPLDGESTHQLDTAPAPASTLGNRTDKIVIRELEPFSRELAYLIGGTHSGQVRTSIGTGSGQPDYYGVRGGAKDDQWWAWADGAVLHVFGGTGGGFGDATPVAAGASKFNVTIAGRRASDDALIILYTESSDLNMISVNSATGALIDGPINIESLADPIDKVDAVLDQNDDVRIVFQHHEPNRQVYTHKVSAAAASFGAPLANPDYVLQNGPTANEELLPQIEVCRNGISHITYISGSSQFFGTSLIYARVDKNGVLLSSESHAIASSVGKAGTDKELGAVAETDFNRIYTQAMTLTPHDEVYVSLSAKKPAETHRTAILLFSPEFAQRSGFPMLVVDDDPAYRIIDVGMAHGDGGELIASFRDIIVSDQGLVVYHIDTQPGLNGIIDFVRNVDELVGYPTVATTDPELRTDVGPAGELIHSWKIGSDIERIHSPGWEGELPELHPRDVLLHSIDIPSNATEIVEERGVTLFNVRPKRVNYPILVGQNGDYQGYDSLRKGLAVAARGGGGPVVLRCGCHDQGDTLVIPANVSLIGEAGATIQGDVRLQGDVIASVTINGNVVESATPFPPEATEPGSWVLMTGAGATGFHQVAKRLRNRSDGGGRVLLASAPGGIAPGGTGMHFYVTGLKLENLIIDGTLNIRRARWCSFKNISMIKDVVFSFVGDANYECTFENFDFIESFSGGGLSGNVFDGENNVYKYLRFADTKGFFEIGDTEQFPKVIGCRGDDSDPAQQTFRATGARSTPIFITECEGRWNPFGNADFLHTNTGKLIRLPEGLGALKFQDDNTRAGGADIPLSDGANDTLPAPSTSLLGAHQAAIHDNVAGEIVAVAAKGTPVIADTLLIEDSADSNAKKSATLASLPFAQLAANNVFTKMQRSSVTTLADAATIAVSAEDSNSFQVTITASRTLGNPTNVVTGDSWVLVVTEGGAGGFNLSYEANYDWGDEGEPDLSLLAAGESAILSFRALSPTHIAASASTGFAP